MKKIFILFFVFLLANVGFASEDVVYLESANYYFYDNPTSVDEMLEIANNQSESIFNNDEKDDFLLDEEFTESKFEKVFTKFINNKIQNGRMNLITAPINY